MAAAKNEPAQAPKPLSTETEAVTIDIDKLTEAQLIDLNNRVVARLKFLSEMRAHASMLKFRIGERVAFQPDDRPEVVGVITKYNRKSVTVITDSGQQWNVAPTFLRSASSQYGAAPTRGRVIDLAKR
ncbi:MAG: hypothetical protein ACKVQA_14165 [Burkholderiales bacterium]